MRRRWLYHHWHRQRHHDCRRLGLHASTRPFLLLLMLLDLLFIIDNNPFVVTAAATSSTVDGGSDDKTSCDATTTADVIDGDDGGSCHNPDNDNDDDDSTNLLECHVYMAASTLGDKTNLGMYTARPLKRNEVVKYPEIAIPLLFRDWGEHPPYADGDGNLWDRYIWEGDVTNIEPYDDHDRSITKAVFIPGLGCTVNSILEMNNINSASGSIYDTAGLSRTKDPGSGAFSPYHHAVTRTTQDIPAGSELLASYGDAWIPWIPGAAVTRNQHLDEADEFLDEYWEWLQQIQTTYVKEGLVSDELKEALWKLTSKDFPLESRVFSVLPRRADWKAVEESLMKRDAMKKMQQQEQLQGRGGGGESQRSATPPVPSIPRDFIRQNSMRTVEWLQEHGKCQDHLRPGRSTIEQAGRGAFAARNLPKGTIVGYAPLIHIGEKALDLWTMEYNSPSVVGDKHKNVDPAEESSYTKLDLIINYSFGHANSTLLLTPYGAMVNYINHDKERANVQVAWPDPTEELVAHKPEWLQKDVPFLRNTINKVGLSFDYVALRDIKDGEEIFMDYGDAWQEAWEEHVAQWTPPPDADEYVHSSDFQLDYFRTQQELKSNPYPSNLHTMCYESYRKDASTGRFQFVPVLRKDHHRVYCTVMMRKQPQDGNNVYTYSVELEPSTGSDESIIVHGVTTDGLFLYDKAYTNDWHLQNAFRQKIMIPDEIFPESWKNL